MLIFDQLKKNDPPLRLLTLVVLCSLLVLLAGLWWVQVVCARYFEAKLETQSFRTVRIPANRGKILDRNGISLAENRPGYNVSLYLEELSREFRQHFSRALLNFQEQNKHSANRMERGALAKQTRYQVASNVAYQVSARLQCPFTLVETNFHRHYEQNPAIPLRLLANLDGAQIARFMEQSDLSVALDLDIQPVRMYPYPTTVAHLLGYVRWDDSSVEGEVAFFNYRLPDFRGMIGIEAGFDRDLRGKAGAKSVLVNNLGYRQSENVWAEAEPGKDVFLTIDLPIQQAAERALLRLGPYGANTRGAAVVMDARNGDILALVSSPTYNPNQFVQRMTYDEWQRLNDEKLMPQINRATQGGYAPGSIFKTVVALAALDAGLNPAQIYHVEPDPKRPGKGCIYVADRKIEDTVAPGEYDFKRALIHSSNAYFVTNGLRAGIQNIVKLGQRFHLGELTGLPTRQEVRGSFPSLKRVGANWYDGNTANVCIGQDPILVTPLQMAVVTAAIANGGKVFYPRVIGRIEAQDPRWSGDPTIFPAGRVRDELGVKPRSLEILRDAMLADTEDREGTAFDAFHERDRATPLVKGMRVCGKTGTAQVKNARGEKVDQNTWFISFAPYENPRYAVVVMVESGGSGGVTCTPIARDIYLAIQKREQSGEKPETLAQAD